MTAGPLAVVPEGTIASLGPVGRLPALIDGNVIRPKDCVSVDD